jgi:hypothetical protein
LYCQVRCGSAIVDSNNKTTKAYLTTKIQMATVCMYGRRRLPHPSLYGKAQYRRSIPGLRRPQLASEEDSRYILVFSKSALLSFHCAWGLGRIRRRRESLWSCQVQEGPVNFHCHLRFEEKKRALGSSINISTNSAFARVPQRDLGLRHCPATAKVVGIYNPFLRLLSSKTSLLFRDRGYIFQPVPS